MRAFVVSLLASLSLALALPLVADAQEEGEAAPSAAHDAEAQALFQAGRVAFSDGRFADALQHFRRSYELSRRPELLYNIGNAADRLQHEEEALEAFEAYLREMDDPPNRREVEARIAVLREHVEGASAEPEPAVEEPVDAASAPVVDPLAEEAPSDAGGGGGIESEWWFWTLLGGVVVGAAALVTVLVLVNQEPTYRDYTLGDDGVVHLTLTVPW